MIKLKRLLLIPDTHSPYHDERAWELVMTVGADWKPDVLVHLGDLADMYSVSAHEKDPARAHNLVSEITITNQLIDEMDSLGAARRIFCAGNHENRLERYLASEAPALAGLEALSIPKVFSLRERGWEYVPYRSHTKVGKLHVTHDVGHAGKTAIFQTGAAFESNVAFGHTHRMGTHYFGNAKGESHVAASFGWLGDIGAADYMHKVKAAREWQLGFGLGYLLPSGTVHLQPIPIVRYSCVVEGKLYRA